MNSARLYMHLQCLTTFDLVFTIQQLLYTSELGHIKPQSDYEIKILESITSRQTIVLRAGYESKITQTNEL